jgi:hypothetical protein
LNDFDPTPALIEPKASPAGVSPDSTGVSDADTAFDDLRSPIDRVRGIMDNPKRFGASESHRTAAVVFALLAQTAAVDRATDVAARLADAAERANTIAEQQLAETRKSNQLQFFTMDARDFTVDPTPPAAFDVDGNPAPDSLYVQIKRSLGFIAPAPEPEEPENSYNSGDEYV